MASHSEVIPIELRSGFSNELHEFLHSSPHGSNSRPWRVSVKNANMIEHFFRLDLADLRVRARRQESDPLERLSSRLRSCQLRLGTACSRQVPRRREPAAV